MEINPALGILATGVDFYCGKFASAIRSVNNSNNRKGVIIDINWALIYSVSSQS